MSKLHNTCFLPPRVLGEGASGKMVKIVDGRYAVTEVIEQKGSQNVIFPFLLFCLLNTLVIKENFSKVMSLGQAKFSCVKPFQPGFHVIVCP